MIKTSIGVQELRRRIAIKAKADTQHRFWGLYCHLWKQDILLEAYRLTRRNNGAPGIDGVTFKEIETKIGIIPLIEEISKELRNGQYIPSKLREVEIPKPDGKKRKLKIATIKDRIVQGALKLVLEPIFESTFQEGSYGYRPNRGAHQALDKIKTGMKLYLYRAIDLDLKSYFDTIRHDILLNKIAQKIQDNRILKLCKQILKTSGKIGVPQGSLVGPLFSNLYLNDVDKMLEKAKETTRYKGYNKVEYVRFADDLVVLVSASPYIVNFRLMEKIQYRLKEELNKLKVEINHDKTKIVSLDQGETLDFLGFTFRVREQTEKFNYR